MIGMRSGYDDVSAPAAEGEFHFIMASLADIPTDADRIEFGCDGIEHFVALGH
jgi:hypothetical protein